MMREGTEGRIPERGCSNHWGQGRDSSGSLEELVPKGPFPHTRGWFVARIGIAYAT